MQRKEPQARLCRSHEDSDQQLLRAAWAQPRALAGPPAMPHLCPLGVLTSLPEDQGPRQAQNPPTRSLHRPLLSGWLSTPTPTSHPFLTGHGTCPVLPCQCLVAGVFATYPSWSVSSLRWRPAQGQGTSVLKEHRAARVSTVRVRGQGTATRKVLHGDHHDPWTCLSLVSPSQVPRCLEKHPVIAGRILSPRYSRLGPGSTPAWLSTDLQAPTRAPGKARPHRHPASLQL